VIAGDRNEIHTPADLSGRTVGVTGLPSDDAVLQAVFSSSPGGGPPPETVTIGFDSVAALTSGRVDAATAFWNAEGVALREAGVPIREFRVDDYGAPSYPELVLVTTRERLDSDGGEIASIVAGLREGYASASADPGAALDDLVAAVPGLDRQNLAAQLDALDGAFDPPLRLDRPTLERWAEYAARYGIVDQRPDVGATFDFGIANGG
jgi:putative hydroxymethylpyrimidine transport system substrate-binding protein